MRVLYYFYFLTLVLTPTFSVAAPSTKETLESTPLTTEEDPYLLRQNGEPERTSLFQLALGYSGGPYLERDQYLQGPFLALSYLPRQEDLIITWDYQVELHKDNRVGLSVGRRWYCCERDPYNPYLRVATHLIIQGSDELGGLAALRRWRLRAGAGIGETFTSEFGVGMSITGPDLYAQFGINF